VRPINLTRGGPSAIAGFLFLLLGFTSAFIGAGSVYQGLIVGAANTGLPIPSAALWEMYSLLLAGGIAAVTGGVLLAVSRYERFREEDLLLDPLEYRRTRHHGRRVVLYAGVAVLLIVVPPLFFLPAAHPIAFSVPVATCTDTIGNEVGLALPRYAILTYSWHSSNGAAVSFVRTPSGPAVYYWSASLGNFTESSAGWSGITGNGSTLYFYACDTPARASASGTSSVTVTGTYYTPIL
jgi:hypothetical protein